MKRGNWLPLFLIDGGMELSWLYAWAAFLTTLAFHQPFPVQEAVGPFALAAAFTLFPKERGWRVIQILGLHLVGFILEGSSKPSIMRSTEKPIWTANSWPLPDGPGRGCVVRYVGLRG